MVEIKKIISTYLRRVTLIVVIGILVLMSVIQVLAVERQAEKQAEERFLQIEQIFEGYDKGLVESEDPSDLFSLLNVGEETSLYAVNPATGEIEGCTDSDLLGKTLDEIGIDLEQVYEARKGFHSNVEGKASYCVFTRIDGYLVGSVVSSGDLYKEIFFQVGALILILALSAIIFIYETTRYVDQLVIRNIQEVNEKLRVIAGGDLKERVELRDSLEFSELSDHINEMVQSLSDKLDDEYQYQAELTEALKMAGSANKTKNSFLFSMSHDVRTPMNAIIGYTNLAKQKEQDPQIQDYLEKISYSSAHLLNLINDVLEMAQIESGKVNFNLKPYFIPDELKKTESIFAMEMEKKGIHFSVLCDLQDEIAFYDKLHMEKIEMNLISNALKFTPAGGTVNYFLTQIGRRDDGYGIYQGKIVDTGIGMSSEFCKRAFEPFEREHTATANGILGTGLGLSITKNIIEQMGGTISCTSVAGAGTEVQFVVSLKVGTEDDLKNEEQPEVEPVDFSEKRILLVEDNELNREITCEILQDFGFSVETAEDGAIGLEMMALSQPGYYDLILMDIQMPNMDGYQATRAIRKLADPELANIPIIAVTANTFDVDQKTAYAAGMNDHLPKPIDVGKLIETISKYLS